jgi:hypothetical protein
MWRLNNCEMWSLRTLERNILTAWPIEAFDFHTMGDTCFPECQMHSRKGQKHSGKSLRGRLSRERGLPRVPKIVHSGKVWRCRRRPNFLKKNVFPECNTRGRNLFKKKLFPECCTWGPRVLAQGTRGRILTGFYKSPLPRVPLPRHSGKPLFFCFSM